MSAGFGLIGIAAERAANRVCEVAIVIDDEIGMAVAGEPALDLVVVLSEGGADGTLRGFTIGPGRGGGNFALVAESLAELVVCTTDVLAKRVAAGGLVLGKVVGLGAIDPDLRVDRSRGWIIRSIAGSRRVARERECRQEQRD